jgi:succinate dehydrogenase / fumarate reductase cytochrome b subunit
MAKAQAPLSPHLQIYRWQLTMITSITHRATGMFLSAGALVLCYWVFCVASGPARYQQLMDILYSGPGRVFLLLVLLSFYYHLCNGIRHLFWDAVLGFELRTSYLSGYAALAATFVLTALTWFAAS